MTARDQPTAEALEALDQIMKHKFQYGHLPNGQVDNSLRLKDALIIDALAARRVAEDREAWADIVGMVPAETVLHRVAEARKAALEEAAAYVKEQWGDPVIASGIRALMDAPPALVVAAPGPCPSCDPTGACSHPEGSWYACPFRPRRQRRKGDVGRP